MSRIRRALLLALLSLAAAVQAETVTVAVASNFAETARVLAAEFEDTTGHEVRVIQGSTGKLHAQIVHGAPFDVFLSADVARAEDLESRGLIEDGSRFTYAVGMLALWSPDATLSDNCDDLLTMPDDSKVAIANPRLAPYGLAAQRYLQSEGLWDELRPRLVYGENIAQTFQFVATGNARVGFVAVSQLFSDSAPESACTGVIAADADAVLHQQAVLLRRAADNAGAREFLAFLRTADTRRRIEARGYALPAES